MDEESAERGEKCEPRERERLKEGRRCKRRIEMEKERRDEEGEKKKERGMEQGTKAPFQGKV